MFGTGKQKYCGYRKEDLTTPYAKFYNERISPVQTHIAEALKRSPYPSGKIPGLDKATDLLNEGYLEIESGYSLEPDGSAHVAALTVMTGVTPFMWDWWFGWHGDKADRYKLWHPKAHIDAQWKDGKQDQLSYIGRTSMIQEYIGKPLEKASIQFVSPEELGFKTGSFENKNKNVFICARIGFTEFPLDFGWLVHQVRSTENGSEMRSRFWLGGKHIQLRMNGTFPELLSGVLQKARRVSEQQAKDLFIHCSEEMDHLAAFLPQLYAEFH